MARTLGAAVAAGALAWVALAGAGATSGAVAPVADEAPGFAVEDFNYPQADKILAEKNIVLKRGDGHIVLVDCASGTGLLEVWARDKEKICFNVTGNSGWLTMEIPSVHLIKGNDYTTQVDMTVGTEEKTFDIAKNAWTSVGESADPEGREHMLVEIRSTK
ncbi:hypothetical protein J4032_28330 [Streptomyces formicae]|uniref:Secreted protein n=1 Tax=Streptomyces formicae TaxID=1616117 RepID=A0ABY3WQF3_9ACTN|nr:hypothetical protein [Streptomyces formicae]UNM14848.1 hypothetical protein J4032_28305 [Streptomyces formicae]UNM14852.1 hypothetical protein J4032_28330 [Streptomyces formicae]